MSTYLVAVLISEFECRENAVKNFSVCAEPLKLSQTEYAFDVGQKMMKTFDELFDYKYNTDMTKLTMASVPNYAGMENWGENMILSHLRRLLIICDNFFSHSSYRPNHGRISI